MTTDILNEYLVSAHKRPVAHIQNLLIMSNKQTKQNKAEDNTIRSDIDRYTPINSSEFLLYICAQDVYMDQTDADRVHHKLNHRSEAAPNYATEYLTTDTIYIHTVPLT
jgi:hypothetical protein